MEKLEKEADVIFKHQKQEEDKADSLLGIAHDLMSKCTNPQMVALCEQYLQAAQDKKNPNAEDFIKQAMKLEHAS